MPSETLHKQHIARAFSQAAASYDNAAVLQQHSGLRLLRLLEQQFSDGLDNRTILDIGAGSGWTSQQIRRSGGTVWALDLAEGMLRHIAQHQRADACILADAENLPLADHSVDACFSNLAVQWCDLDQAAAEMQRVIRKNGTAAVATLGHGSLHQLKTAWQSVGQPAPVNPFLTESEIQTAFQAFADVQIHTETYTQTFPTLESLLRSLKNIGANHVLQRGNKGLTGKQSWQRFQTAYEPMRDPNGMLPLDYKIVYIVATGHR
ncbi:malonyl-ACP O-methyltransferase BioC [Neisseria zalophi]|uniref:Malonyl-[acyl-carrier protein] O-methyltransferase n=1 Tax=Neisseria zalophi TaxID=640030 RepID=A0A5J6PVI5_9NEIS|nr:malonyl-ACP O-methyltransferase BioC [Neisseria zalophi]QEY26254.1 malonyl-[acyl-carrier protein] O-methyltransferase BioC [Neisseria zalophi]